MLQSVYTYKEPKQILFIIIYLKSLKYYKKLIEDIDIFILKFQFKCQKSRQQNIIH